MQRKRNGNYKLYNSNEFSALAKHDDSNENTLSNNAQINTTDHALIKITLVNTKLISFHFHLRFCSSMFGMMILFVLQQCQLNSKIDIILLSYMKLFFLRNCHLRSHGNKAIINFQQIIAMRFFSFFF